ncbi:hypothetical protein [Flavobacterium sp.]|uniref:tetratricopeptide repeat protein n=1 Tax=Flavobacterium sp. TaxID=239 RepID=UPI00261EE88B|nr:hypothetical protein [Flavobacterium sp.]
MRKLLALITTLTACLFTQTTDAARMGRFCVNQLVNCSLLHDSPEPDLKQLEALGDKAGQNKNWELAIKYYKQLVQARPEIANYHYKYGGALGMFAKECNKFKALGMIGEIKNSFETAIKLDGKHIEARYALIELYLELPAIVGGSERKAQQYASELLKISPIDGYLSRGRIAEYFKRYKVAENYYLQAYKLGNSRTTKQKLINLYKLTKQFDKLQKLG